MLLGAAQYLAETRNFKGSVAVIFQPAEEGGAGALAMLDDGMMDKFGIKEVYGMHNAPGMPVGNFAIRKGSLMAAADSFEITINGNGSHAAAPHLSIDPVLASAHVVIALQSIVSRGVDPLKSLVVSVTTTHGGTAHNVIPSFVTLTGTVRTLLPETRDFAEKRLKEVAQATAQAYGAIAEINYHRGYPVTFNHDNETEFAIGIAGSVAGVAGVDANTAPRMGAEDFSYMLESRPGAFIFIGNGDTAGLHHPAYDFNDDVLPYGISYWVTMAEKALAV
jgi:hippurate hydrolase